MHILNFFPVLFDPNFTWSQKQFYNVDTLPPFGGQWRGHSEQRLFGEAIVFMINNSDLTAIGIVSAAQQETFYFKLGGTETI